MAIPTFALHRIRKARRQKPTPPAPAFDRHRDDYEAILRKVYDLAVEEAVDDVAGWIIVETARDGVLPVPSTVRTRAIDLLAARGVDVPDDSSLRRT